MGRGGGRSRLGFYGYIGVCFLIFELDFVFFYIGVCFVIFTLVFRKVLKFCLNRFEVRVRFWGFFREVCISFVVVWFSLVAVLFKRFWVFWNVSVLGGSCRVREKVGCKNGEWCKGEFGIGASGDGYRVMKGVNLGY